MITLATAEQNTKSLLFEADETSDQSGGLAPYWLSGSCLVFTFRRQGFVLTAAHALAFGGDNPGERLRVFAHEDLSGTSLPFDKHVSVGRDIGESGDLALLRIALHQCTPEQVERVRRVDLERLRPPECHHRPGVRVFIPGFPSDRKAIHYDENVISLGRAVHGATLSGSEGLRRIHRVTLDNPNAHASMQGFSGAPVFGAAAAGGVRVCPSFDGVVITAPPTGTTIARFICSSVVYAMLDGATADAPVELL